MREGWTYKKLMDLCSVKTGKKDANHANDQGKYRFYTCAENYLMCNTHSFSGKCLILPGNGVNVGKVFKYDGLFEAYQRTYVIHNIKEDINYDFLYYVFLKNWKHIGVAQQYGSATNYIKIGNFESFIIGFPPLSEQERIVSELDLLSGIIEKKKSQLKEYDQLAQSIFYDMFGDPVTNEKGWEMKRLEDACLRITDGSHFSPKEDEKGKYPMLSVKDMGANSFIYEHCKLINEKDYLFLVANGCKPSINDVLVAKDGSYLKTSFVQKEDKEQVILSSIAILTPLMKKVSPEYLAFLFKLPQTKSIVERNYLTGTALKRVILKGFKMIRIPLPPLPLQHSFAEKIEAIEKQKELIKQSIAETETLFNSRMDYYFN